MSTITSCLPVHVTIGQAMRAEKLVNALIEAGYSIAVFDGEDWCVKITKDAQKVLRGLASTDSDVLRIRAPSTEVSESGRDTGIVVGAITLVWGNDPDGSDLVSDWSWHDNDRGNAFNEFVGKVAYS